MHIEHRKIYIKYLRNLGHLLNKLNEQSHGDAGFLKARLSPDMLPLESQVTIVAAFAMRACLPDAGNTIPAPKGNEISTETLIRYLNQVAAAVENSPSIESVTIEDKAGFNNISMNAEEYVGLFSLPNFFFHLSMVYAIARNRGFSLTKGDFDGIHDYPAGFSWEDHK